MTAVFLKGFMTVFLLPLMLVGFLVGLVFIGLEAGWNMAYGLITLLREYE